MLAIDLLRIINTAEVEYKVKHGAYASRNAPLGSDQFKGKCSAKIESMGKASISSGPEVLPGWTLRLNVTADGQGYDLLLEDTMDKCDFAAVTNERGIIRESKAIGCRFDRLLEPIQ